MKIANLLLTGTLMLTSFSIFAAEPVSDVGPLDGLPSPYFVDEVHCSGINIPDIHEGWLLEKEEVEPARKVEQGDMCEQVLRVFGLTKYQWLSPDDLERTATLIRQSGYFLESDLSIRKSELKNHVHIFLNVKPGVRYTKMLSDEFKMYGGKGQGSSRLYDTFTAEITDHKYAPVRLNTFGITLTGTSANSTMTSDSGQTITVDDLQKLHLRDEYLADLYWKYQSQLTKTFSYDLGLHLDDDKNYSDGHDRLNMVLTTDILATRRVNVVSGNVFIGPAALFTTYTPYQVVGSESSSGVFMPGFIVGYNYGQEWGNNLKFKMAYYASQRDQSIFQMDLSLQKHMHFFDSYLIAGFKQRSVRNAVLPEDRFPLGGSMDSDNYIGLAKIFHGSESVQQISAVVGAEQLKYASDLPTYQQNAAYVGLRYKVLEGTWNVNLAASYYFQRLY